MNERMNECAEGNPYKVVDSRISTYLSKCKVYG